MTNDVKQDRNTANQDLLDKDLIINEDKDKLQGLEYSPWACSRTEISIAKNDGSMNLINIRLELW